MKVFNFGKTACIVLVLIGLIFSQAYADDISCTNLRVTDTLRNLFMWENFDLMANAMSLSLNWHASGVSASSQLFSNFLRFNKDTYSGQVGITDDGLVLGTSDHPEVLIDKNDGNLVVSTDIELTGYSNDIKAEADIKIKSGGEICIGTCDQ